MKVLLCWPSMKDHASFRKLKGICDLVIPKKHPDRKELLKAAKEYDGMIVGTKENIDEELLKDSRLRFVSFLGKGIDTIDAEAMKRNGKMLLYAPECNTFSTAEHAFSLMINLAKDIMYYDKRMRDGLWRDYSRRPIDLKGKVLGIVGAGSIAKELTKMAKAFGMEVICYTPHPERHTDMKVEFATLREIMKRSDFVSVNIFKSKETINLISEKELKLMKPSAYFINTARGPIVDEEALIRALKAKKIAGAGLDVFTTEPLGRSELLKLDNVILTPHIAGTTVEASFRMIDDIVEDIIAVSKGKRPKYRFV